MKKAIWSLLTLAALTFTLAVPATASIVINSTGGTSVGDLPLGPMHGATVFTAGTGGAITDLKLGLYASAAGDNYFSAALRSVGPGNVPTAGNGGILASVILPVTITVGDNTLYDFTSLGALGAYSLTPDTQYALTFYGAGPDNYIGLSILDPVNYAVADGFTVQGLGYSVNNGASFKFVGNTIGSMNIQVSTSASAVPEPSTYALLCISLGVVGYARKKMGKQ